jgi:hypothetical protein
MARSQSQSQSPAPEPTPVVLGALAESALVHKATRVFVDVPGIPRVILADGSVSAVQREKRSDGSDGPYVLALGVKKAPGATEETAQRFTLAGIQAASRAYAAHGITLVEPGAAPTEE